MHIPRFAKVLVAFLAGVMLVQLLHACSPSSQAAEKTRLTRHRQQWRHGGHAGAFEQDPQSGEWGLWCLSAWKTRLG